MFLENRNNKIFLSCVFLTIWMILALFEVTNGGGKLLSGMLITIASLMVIRVAVVRNYGLVLFFIFLWMYASIPIDFFFEGKAISVYRDAQSPGIIYTTTLILCLFYIVVYLFTSFKRSSQNSFKSKPNNAMYWCSIAVLIFAILVGRTGDTILSAGGYVGSLENSSGSIINEYAIIFILIAWISSQKGSKRKILYLLCILYCVKNLLYGGRIQTLMVCILLFVVHFQYILSIRALIICGIIGFIFMRFFGALRGDPVAVLSGDWVGILLGNTQTAPDISVRSGADVFYASMRNIYFVYESILSVNDRVNSFIYYILSVIIPYSYLPDIANLSTYLSAQYPVGGGGLAPIYFFVFLSWPGVLLLGWFVAKVVNVFSNGPILSYKYVYAILFIVCVPRWFAYYPIQLIKLCVYGVVFYVIFSRFKPISLSMCKRMGNK